MNIAAELEAANRALIKTDARMKRVLFKLENMITDEEFATNHWQVLFAIRYPEAWS